MFHLLSPVSHVHHLLYGSTSVWTLLCPAYYSNNNQASFFSFHSFRKSIKIKISLDYKIIIILILRGQLQKLPVSRS